MLKDLFHLFYPSICMGCNIVLLTNEKVLCTSCRTDLPFTNQHLFKSNEASNKFFGKLNIQNVSCLLYFTKKGIVANIMHHLKYNNHPEISYYLGAIYAEYLADTNLLATIDTIVVVPMHKSKLSQRGYNQVDGFAKAIAEKFTIPIDNSILTKKKKTISQTKYSLLERIKTHQHSFFLQNTNQQENKHFLLLDDILTTGSTLEACARLLLQIPGASVTILCLAYTK